MPDSNQGNLAVLTAGFGCLAATFVTGCLLVRKGLLPAAGSITWMPAPALGCGTLHEALGLVPLSNLVFGGWSLFADPMSKPVETLGLAAPEHFQAIRAELRADRPMRAYFDPDSPLEPIDGSFVKNCATKAEYADALADDIRRFQQERACPRAVVLWCGSTERPAGHAPVFDSVEAFEAGLRGNHPAITSSQVYAWAAAKAGAPFASASPNGAIGFPALEGLSAGAGVPQAGEVFRPVSWALLDRLGNQPAAESAPPPYWWEGREAELREWQPAPGMYSSLLAERRAEMPLLDSRRTAPAMLDVVLLLDWARRQGMAGVQHWMDFFFLQPPMGSRPASAGQLAAALADLVQGRPPGPEE